MLGEEKTKLNLVGRELLKTTIASKERGEVLDKINAEYGTTLQNLGDEAAMATQLSLAYEKVVDQLKQKINIEIINEDIKSTMRTIGELEDELAEMNDVEKVFDLTRVISGASVQINLGDAREKVDLLFLELDKFSKNVSSGKGGPKLLADRFKEVKTEISGTTGEAKKLRTELENPLDGILAEDKEADFASFKRNLQQRTREVEIELRKRGLSEIQIKDALEERKLKDLEDERDAALEIFGSSNQKFLDLDLAVRREIDKRRKADADFKEKERKREAAEDAKRKKEQLDDAKDLANKTLEITKLLVDNKIAQIDREIEARQNEIAISETEIGRLQELAAAGNTDAAEAIKAERVGQARDKIEIEGLEKKKRNLLIQVAALNQANLLLQSSDVNGLENAGAKMQSFINNLPKLYDGTKGTVADTFGATGTKDGHIVRLHDNEHVIGANDSNSLHAAGLKNNADIVGSALAYQNSNVKSAIKNIKIVQQHIDLSSGKEVIVDGNKTTRNNHRPSQFRV
mgnify:CR=1 FL=1